MSKDYGTSSRSRIGLKKATDLAALKDHNVTMHMEGWPALQCRLRGGILVCPHPSDATPATAVCPDGRFYSARIKTHGGARANSGPAKGRTRKNYSFRAHPEGKLEIDRGIADGCDGKSLHDFMELLATGYFTAVLIQRETGVS